MKQTIDHAGPICDAFDVSSKAASENICCISNDDLSIAPSVEKERIQLLFVMLAVQFPQVSHIYQISQVEPIQFTVQTLFLDQRVCIWLI